MGLNYIALAGEVISFPEKKHTPDGQAVTTFTISMPSTDDNETNNGVIKISAIKKLADKVLNTVNVGDTILVEGKLYTKIVENKFSQKHKIPFIQATNVEILKSKNNTLSLSDLDDVPVSTKYQDKLHLDDEEIPF